jgi:hypothetical protein
MSSTSETGHVKNVANFEKLLVAVSSFGAAYNPSKTDIKTEALTALLANAKNAIGAVNAAEPAFKNAVAAREVEFEKLGKLLTRISNALKASDTTSQTDDTALSLLRKLQGRRASAKLSDEEKKNLEAEGKSTAEASSSRMSFDSRLDNFDKLIKLLASIEGYAPNEAGLKVGDLTAFYNELVEKNNAVALAENPLAMARIARNDALYKPGAGLVDISVDVKNYVKSVYGASSPQYRTTSALSFTHGY